MHASKSHCRRSLPPVEVCVRTISLGCLVLSPCALAAAGAGHAATPFSCQLLDATTSLEPPAATTYDLYERSSARRSQTNANAVTGQSLQSFCHFFVMAHDICRRFTHQHLATRLTTAQRCKCSKSCA